MPIVASATIWLGVNATKLSAPSATIWSVVNAEIWLVNNAPTCAVLSSPKLASLSETKSIVCKATTCPVRIVRITRELSAAACVVLSATI